jgi:hypothetical protein
MTGKHRDIGHQDPSLPPGTDPDHFGEYRPRVKKMVKGIAGNHQGK